MINSSYFPDTTLARVGYYQEIRDYVKGKDANALVIGNPGTSFTNNPSGQTTYTVDDLSLIHI